MRRAGSSNYLVSRSGMAAWLVQMDGLERGRQASVRFPDNPIPSGRRSALPQADDAYLVSAATCRSSSSRRELKSSHRACSLLTSLNSSDS